MPTSLTAEQMEERIRNYYEGCNSADATLMESCLAENAVHYFPPGMYEGPFIGAAKIAARWQTAVEQFGSMWTIDHLLLDRPGRQAVLEWTHFKTKVGVVLRGDEWMVFDEQGLICEIRAYYASPQASGLDRLELVSHRLAKVWAGKA